MPLPVLSCDGCGACCTYMGTMPVGWYLGDLPLGDASTLPTEVLTDLARRLLARDFHDGPCIWYDPATRRCRHHEHRPQLCRDFEVGGEDCLRVRLMVGVRDKLEAQP